MSDYWTQKSNQIGGASISTGLMAANALNQAPTVELPEVGAKMLLVIHPYGGVSVSDGEQLGGGLDVVEVEVTAIKKTKVTIE